MITLSPQFPPLIKGLAAGPANPLTIAMTEAEKGTDAGLLVWSINDQRLRAALVLAPEEPLSRATAGYIACSVGLQNALGVQAPPETAVHLEWAGGVRLNGAHAGALHLYASTAKPDEIPAWMIVSVELSISLPDSVVVEPGQTPDWTALDQEGCGDVNAVELLEAWARHTLVWINELDEPNGRATLYREWKGLVWKLGEQTSAHLPGERVAGTFLGVDENFGMLMKLDDGQSRLIPLTALVERA